MNRKNRLGASSTFAVTLIALVAALVLGGCSDSGTETAAKTEPAPAPTVKPAGEAPAPTPTPVPEKVAATAKPAAPKSESPTLSAKAATSKPAAESKSTDVVIDPARLDLGEIPTNDAKSGTIMITNNGTVAHTLLECKTSCGCTTANCQKNKVLQPGDSVSVDIKLSGGQRPAKLAKTVTFIVSDQAPIQLPVSGTSIAFVEVTPDRLSPEKHPEGKITLRAIDDVPFTIKSMFPPLIETFDLDPKVKHEIYMSWDALREAGHRTSKILFNLDHPKAAKAFATLDLRALQGLEPANAPIDIAGQNPSRIDLDRLLKDGKTVEVLALLEKGDLDMNSVDSSGQTPLVKAARWGNPDVIQAFLDASADISQGDKIGRSPLMYACQSKDLESVRVLLDSGASLTDRDQIGNTALCWAAGFGTPDIVGVLLEEDAEVEVVGAMTGFTPLIWASGFGEPESVKMLLEAGADINAADALQRATPLMNAVRTGSIENVIVLLDAGADLEARDAEGKTTLLVAASNAGPDVEKVKLLVERGADLEAKTTNGQTALDLARKRTDLRATEVADYLATVIGAH